MIKQTIKIDEILKIEKKVIENARLIAEAIYQHEVMPVVFGHPNDKLYNRLFLAEYLLSKTKTQPDGNSKNSSP